jgi:hypothetical protein
MYILTFICRVGGWVFNFFCVCESHRISLPTAKGGGGHAGPPYLLRMRVGGPAC